jgi:hypothetical protein
MYKKMIPLFIRFWLFKFFVSLNEKVLHLLPATQMSPRFFE